MERIRLVVTGGRDFKDIDFIETHLNSLKDNFIIVELIQGEVGGVDSICKNWALKNNIPVRSVPAQWDNLDVHPLRIKTNRFGKKYNVMAGANRNQQMLDDEPRPNYAIVFPGGKGTNDMRNRVIKAGLTIWDLYKCD